MPIATTNRVRIGLVREVTLGTTPATPNMQTLRATSAGMQGAPKTVTSDELISDRNVADLILVGKDIGGDLGFEVSCNSHEQLLEAALFSAFTRLSERTNTPNAAGITAVSATAYTTAAAGTTQPGAYAQNDIVLAHGFTNAGNNRTFVAGAASSATSIVMTGGVVEASPPATARIKKIGIAGASADIAATTSGGNALTSTTLNFTTAGFVIGMWVKIGSAGLGAAYAYATTANNGWARVSAVTATRLSFDIVPTGFATDTGTGKTIALFMGDYARNGITQLSHTLELSYLDNGVYQYFTGMVCDQLSLAADAQAVLKGSFSFVGMDNTVTTSRTSGAVDYTQPPAPTDVMNTSSNVGRISENGVAITGPNFVLKAAINIKNNLRAQVGVGSIGAVGVGAGSCQVTGVLGTYFGDSTILAKVLANTATAFDMRVADSAGNTMIFDMPRIKLATGAAPVPGSDQDVTVEVNYQAIKHPTLGYSIHVQKVEAVA